VNFTQSVGSKLLENYDFPITISMSRLTS